MKHIPEDWGKSKNLADKNRFEQGKEATAKLEMRVEIDS